MQHISSLAALTALTLTTATPVLAEPEVSDPGSVAQLVAAVAQAEQKLHDVGATIEARQEAVNKAIAEVQQARDVSGAKNVSAVVLDAKTGEVLAMSNDNTYDPSQDIGRQADKQMGNLAVSSPFEPGSVNKIVTASSVIEYGLSNPDEVLSVPGSIDMEIGRAHV